MKTPARHLVPFLVLAVTLAGWPALAQPASPDATYNRAADLREQHHDAEALDLFRQVWTQARQARALAQVALCEGALGRWVEAERDLVASLALTTDPWIRQHRAALEGALRTMRTHLGSLEVTSNVAGAELWVAGQRVGTLPLTDAVHVPTGSVTFEVRAEGHVPLTRTVDVAASGLARESVTLAPLPPVAPVALTGTTSTPVPATATVTPDTRTNAPTGNPHPAGPTTPRRRRSWQLVTGLVGLGAAVVAAGVGVSGLLIHESAADRYNQGPCLGGDANMADEPPGVCRDNHATAHTGEAMYYAGLGTAAVLAVASVVLLIAAPGPQGERPRAAIAGCVPGLGGVACSWRF